MSNTKAFGAEALLGFAVNGASDRYKIGQPGIDIRVCANPSTSLSAAAGAGGNITGAPNYRFSFRIRGGHRTRPCEQVQLAAVSAKQVDLTSIDTSADVRCDRRDIWRSETVEPAAPLAALAGAGAGNVENGAHPYGVTFIVDGVESDVSPIVVATVVDKTSDGKVAITVIPTYTGSGNCTARRLWRGAAATTTQFDLQLLTTLNDNTTTTYTDNTADASLGSTYAPVVTHYYWLGSIYDNTTGTYTDNLAFADSDIDETLRPATYNETAGNWGLLFVDPDSFDLDADFTLIQPASLGGSAFAPRRIPGAINVSGSPKQALRTGSMPFVLLAGAGTATRTAISGEPTRQFVWDALTARRSPKALTALVYKGSPDVPPKWLYGLMTSEINLSMAQNKLVDLSTKFLGTGYGLTEPATLGTHTGTNTGTFVGIGLRADAYKDTDAVYLKISQGLSGGTWKVKPKVTSGASYSWELTGYYNTTSSKQTKGGAQYNDGIELTNESGTIIGFRDKSTRLPYVLMPTAALTDIAVDDVYQIDPTTAIPGLGYGTSGYTEIPPVKVNTARFTDAHVTLKRGSTVLECTGATLKLSFPTQEVTALCAGARTPLDLVKSGYFTAELAITRRYDSTEWESAIQQDTRYEVTVDLVGELIEITPGVFSTYAEELKFVFDQMGVSSVKSAVNGVGLVDETATLVAEKPDDPLKSGMTITLTTAQDIPIPA